EARARGVRGAAVLCVAWALVSPRLARAQTEPTPPHAAKNNSNDADPPPPAADTGYLPGERRALGLGLSPHAPEVPALPGGLTTAPAGPAPADDWRVNFLRVMSTA